MERRTGFWQPAPPPTPSHLVTQTTLLLAKRLNLCSAGALWGVPGPLKERFRDWPFPTCNPSPIWLLFYYPHQLPIKVFHSSLRYFKGNQRLSRFLLRTLLFYRDLWDVTRKNQHICIFDLCWDFPMSWHPPNRHMFSEKLIGWSSNSLHQLRKCTRCILYIYYSTNFKTNLKYLSICSIYFIQIISW